MGFNSVMCDDLPEYNAEIQRFDARYWSIDYPLTAVSTIVADQPNSMSVYCNFRSNKDLVGLIWSTADSEGHPLFQYASDYDYSRTVFAFQANFPDSYNVTATIQSNKGEKVIRLYPYYDRRDGMLVPRRGSILVSNLPPIYSKSRVAPQITKESEYDWYILDFDNLYEGFNFEGSKVDPSVISQIFIAITPSSYGLGSQAKVADVGGFDKPKTQWVSHIEIEGVSENLILTKGDIVNIGIGIPDIRAGSKGAYIADWKYESIDLYVGEFYGFGTNSRHIKLEKPLDAIWQGGASAAVSLKRDSPIGDVPINVHFENINVTGGRTHISARSYPQPAHKMQMTSGFDDTYNITPWRQVNQVYNLGYRGKWVTYIGMSHYFKAAGELVDGEFKTVLNSNFEPPLNTPTVKHLEGLFRLLQEKNYEFVWSTSYEILNSYMPESWKQLNADGDPALSGWSPPSSFISPTSNEALNYLGAVISQGMDMLGKARLPKLFQIGEPWWWDGSYTNNKPCIYDMNTQRQYRNETGNDVPRPFIRDYTIPVTNEQRPYLEWLGDKLGLSTNHIRDYVKVRHPESQATLLFFTPQIMTPSSEMLPIINFPKKYWQYPEYDFMQMEDYDWLIDNKLELNYLTYEAVELLGYPKELVDYFLGFALTQQETWVWANVDLVAKVAAENGFNSLFVWAYSQVVRDGIVYKDEDEEGIEVQWPSRNRNIQGVDKLSINPVFLFSLGEDIRICSGTHKIKHNNKDWLPVGGFGRIATISENANMAGDYWESSLTGIDLSILANDIDDYKGKKCEVLLSLSADIPPISVASGRISQQDVSISNGTAEITLRISNPFSKGLSAPANRYTQADQEHRYRDDKGFEFIARLQNHKLEWGS